MKRLIFILIFSIFLFSCAKRGDSFVNQAGEATRRHDYEKAESLYLRALEEESNYSPALLYSLLANVKMAQGDLDSATDWLEKSVNFRPDYRLLVTLGATYVTLGKTDKAENALFRAISLNPKKGEALAQLGAIRISQKKYEEAKSLLEQGATAEPRLAVIHANLAIALAKLGKTAESEEEFKKAEELKCENLSSFRARAASLD